MSDAARCRPHPPGRLAVSRAALAGALDRAVDVAAALEVRGYALARRPARRRRAAGRATTCASAPRRCVVAALADRRRRPPGVGHVEAYPTAATWRSAPRELALASALVLCSAPRPLAGPAGAAGGGACLSRSSSPSASRTPTRRPPASRCTTSRSSSSRAPSRCWRACRARASPRCCARSAGSCRTSTAARQRASWRWAASTCASTGRASWPRVCGTVFQEPETQVVMGGVRAELELPLEHRGEPAGGGGARGGGDGAGARHRRTCSSAAPTRSRAASSSASRSPPRMVHGPTLLLLDEPTSQLDPVAGDELVWLLRRLNEDWGTAVVVAEHRLERCLPAADRVIALVDGRVACDAAPARVPRLGRGAPARAGHPGGAAVLARRAARRPASVKEARAGAARAAALRARRRRRRPAARRAGAARREDRSPRSGCAASGSRSRTARACCAALDLRARARASASR